MSKLNKAQRGKLSADSFGDPTRRLFPIVDQDDVNSAARLIGKAKDPDAVKKRIIAIAKRKGLKVPDAWQEKSAKMSTDTLSDDDVRSLLRTAINQGNVNMPGYWVKDVYASYFIYQDYSDDKLYKRTYVIGDDNTVTLGDPVQVVERTSYETVQLAAFALEETSSRYTDGDYVVYPNAKVFEAGDYPDKGVDITPEELLVMAEQFEPVNNNLEHPPHSMRSRGAFAALDGELGQLRKVWVDEDGWTLRGEVTVPSWLDKKLTHKGVSLEIPLEGEPRISGNAITTDPRVPDALLLSAYAEFAGSRHSQKDKQDLQSMHDILVRQGVQCDPANCPAQMNSVQSSGGSHQSPNKENKKMSFKDKWAEFWEKVTPEEMKEVTPADIAGFSKPEQAAAPGSESAEFKALREENAKLRADKRAGEVKATVEALVTAHKILPSEKDEAIREFTQRAADDEKYPEQVTFSVGSETKTGSRVDALKALFEARPAHKLTEERVFNPAAMAKITEQDGEQSADQAYFTMGKEQADAFIALQVRNGTASNGNGNGSH